MAFDRGSNISANTTPSDVSIVANISSEVVIVAGIKDEVVIVANNDANVTTVANDLNGADTIGTVAGDIANVNTVAAISTDVTTVAGVATDIPTVAGIDTEITTVAGIDTEIQALYAQLPAIAEKINKPTTLPVVDGDVMLFDGTDGLNSKSGGQLGSAAFTASSDYATDLQGTNADTAFGWGDHAAVGYLEPSDIGVSVQGYDADTAKTDVAQTFTISQRGTVTTDNDLSFDLSATNNFKCTPTGTGTLTFTNMTSGQSGFVLLDNSGGHTISAAASTKVSAAALSTISAVGVYILSYFTDGTNTYVVNSSALA